MSMQEHNVYPFPVRAQRAKHEPDKPRVKVKRRLRFRPKAELFYIVPIVIMASLAFNLISVVSVRIRQTKYARQLALEIAKLKEYNAELDDEVAWRGTLDYVEQEARKFGMAKPDEVKYQFTVPGAEGDAGPAKRVQSPEIGY
ncbi:MAG TPA: hypothetical protein DF292_05325 [Firmicutes bacterium]|nr:hypothetical protein [Bacillota bacterium]HCT36440.1 hypothetical protein [Bacillota bacterium]